MCKYELLQAFESYHLTDRQTDTTEIIYHAALRVVNRQINCCDVERMRCVIGSCTRRAAKATVKQERLPLEKPQILLTNLLLYRVWGMARWSGRTVECGGLAVELFTGDVWPRWLSSDVTDRGALVWEDASSVE